MSPRSHGAEDYVNEICHGNCCRQESTRLHAIVCTKTGWGSLSPMVECSNRHWLDPFAREKSSLSLKTQARSERELADKKKMKSFTDEQNNGSGRTLP